MSCAHCPSLFPSLYKPAEEARQLQPSRNLSGVKREDRLQSKDDVRMMLEMRISHSEKARAVMPARVGLLVMNIKTGGQARRFVLSLQFLQNSGLPGSQVWSRGGI